MKRKTKNIIIITLIIILGIASGFTVKLAKDSVSTNSENVGQNMGTPPDQGSPSIYSTANINVKDATLVAKASEGIVIEGANTVTIENCDLTDSNTKLNGQSTTYKNIFLYQSMSEDASNGTATFTAKNSNIDFNGYKIYVNGVAIN